MIKQKHILLLSSLLFSTIAMSACDKNNSSSTNGEIKDYTININAITGKNLEGIAVEIYDNDKLVKSALTNSDGDVSFSIEDKDYDIELRSLPKGHYLEKEFSLKKGTYDYDVTLKTKVIEEEMPLDLAYSYSDIVYDFELEDSDGKKFNLSSKLKKKDAVMINFWYVDCYWCKEEFPMIEEAYQAYQDDIEIIAVNYRDNNLIIDDFKYEYDLSFPMAYDTVGLTSAFGVTNFPSTVIIDRYGIISFAAEGAFESKEEISALFDLFIGDDYIPVVTLEEEETSRVPTYSMPTSKEIENVINGDGFNATYYGVGEEETDPGYRWPWIISEDGKSIKASNSNVDRTSSTIKTDVVIEEGKVFAFDYLSSTEKNYDILYVLIDGTIIQKISGEETTWKTCFAYVSEETKSYQISLVYFKDDADSSGDDTVYVNNFRFLNISDINSPTYIYRYCSKNFIEENWNYEIYSNVYYNENDGYYHVDSIDGPLVLAELLKATHWSSEITPYSIVGTNYCVINGIDYSNIINEYASYASNNYLDLTPVTQELKEALVAITNTYGDPNNENEWLELCSYYSSYGTDGKELDDPIKGLAFFSAYEAELGNQNYATFTEPILPRGLKFRFTPEVSGAYKINSYGEEETMCWIYAEDGTLLAESNFDARKFKSGAVESMNFEMYYYFEANKTYYITPAFYDYLLEDTLQFNLEYLGESYEVTTLCSPGWYTTEEDENGEMIMDKIISPGISYELQDDGYYHEIRSDGTVGSIIYADFIYASFLNVSLEECITLGAFNFSVDSEGNTVSGGKDETRNVQKYVNNKVTDKNSEFYGCVPVDEELKNILTSLADKYGFSGVEHHWLKFCYYSQYIGQMSK